MAQLHTLGRNTQVGIASPNPSFPQPISVVTGTQEVLVRGKNLLSEIELGSYSTTNGSKITSSSTYRNANPIPVKPNTTYTFSINGTAQAINVLEYTSTSYIGKIEGTSATFTTSSTTEYINIFRGTTAGIEGWQIESGSTATPFEPHITPTTYTLHLGNMEFAGIEDYADYPYFDVDEGKWYKKKAIEKLILNGTENWNNTYTAFGLSELINKSIASSGGLCNYFIYDSRNRDMTSLTNFKFAIQSISGKTKSSIYIQYTDITSVADFKTWLSTHNTIVYYPLETPTDEEITDTTLIQDLDNILAMMSIEGTTIIEVSGNLPAPTKVRAVKGE